MQSARKKEPEVPDEYKDLANAQKKAVEIINVHLADTLKKLEVMGYTRTELATTYLMLAYHALRHNKPKEKADEVFEIITYFAKRRIESNIREKLRRKKLH